MTEARVRSAQACSLTLPDTQPRRQREILGYASRIVATKIPGGTEVVLADTPARSMKTIAATSSR